MDFSLLTKDIKEYINTQINILKLKAVTQTEKIVSNVLLAIILAILGFLALLFLSLSGALAISSYYNKPFLGFLIVGGIFILMALVVLALKQAILDAPIKTMLKKLVNYKRADKSE